ncbi:MAG: pyrroline-5-carboxylate reductase [Candidatus Omnitrophica bacterium]|nr:pyrroline-5-carboxylate reductase [Candidatus Omnitrophota bacterium]
MRYLAGKKIGVIGLGNMGGAIINGLISSGAVKRAGIIGFDDDTAKRVVAVKKYGILATRSMLETVAHSDIVIFAVKPQNIGEVLREVSFYGKGRLYISIAAGINTRRIEDALARIRRPRVIRVMPNTPALIGEGISAICKGRYAAARDMKAADEIFSSVGETVNLNERYFDLVTAVSGSGPAYFFYLKEALIETAVSLGMDRATAKKLVSKTALGAAQLLIETGHEPGILRQRVTSKGGTTEQAIKVFDRAGVKKIVKKAVTAAVRRSKELSEE